MAERSLFVFTDTGPGRKPRAYVLPARDTDEAWRLFAHKYAIWNFGLKRNSTLKEVKDYFYNTVEVIEPEEVIEFSAEPIMTGERLDKLRALVDSGSTESEALDKLGLGILKDE